MGALRQKFGSRLQENIPLKNFTTIKIGGPAKFFLAVKTKEDLISALFLAIEENIPYFLLGGGSNTLIADKGFEGLVIKNETGGISQKGKTLTVQSGTELERLVDFTIRNGLGWIHKLKGIPGTVGGAIFGNAGASGQAVSHYIERVACVSPSKKQIITLSGEDCQFGYRDSAFNKNGLIILEVKLQFEPAEPVTLQRESVEMFTKRVEKYPPGIKCPGSFFKNVPVKQVLASSLKLIPRESIVFEKIPAGLLLEYVGAKGQRLGDVQFSEKHANLIINFGEGKASDLQRLASEYAQKVKERFGITLEPEVQFINLPPLS